tara:strand:+ start:348 stop:497 length:150 start_codon:yes stop_codon:yes gene_type:complete
VPAAAGVSIAMRWPPRGRESPLRLRVISGVLAPSRLAPVSDEPGGEGYE